MLKKNTLIVFLSCCNIYLSYSQQFIWSGEVRSFFDNVEFGHSKLQIPQTMAGVHLSPEIGFKWDEKHIIKAGFDVMHEFGSDKTIDYHDPLIYYELDNKPWRFFMGAFPRNRVLNRYPRMFFSDSIVNYRPVLNGLFWELYSDKNYANVWLDWTSRQTHTRHEAFFMGWSGKYNFDIFYFQHFGYMYHFAGMIDPEIDEGLHDNGLLLTSAGVDFASKAGFDLLETNVGWSLGLERDRSIHTWHRLQGLLVETKIEYKGLGVFNAFHKSDGQQFFYTDHTNELYWGAPVYRASQYDRADFYINFIKTNVVSVKMTYSLHFTENTMYHEQMLTAVFDIDNYRKTKPVKSEYLWDFLLK